MTHVLILSVILGICCALAEKSEYTTTTTTERSKGLANSENQFLANVIRNKNSSGLVLGDVDEDEETKRTDKKPRTVLHRLNSSVERDNSSCCGSKYSFNSGPTRPDYNYNKIPLETGRFPSQYDERPSIDRYGWQTQGRPPGPVGSGGRPGGGSGSGVYAGSQLGDRYGPRPVHASETASRPSALGYGPGNVGGYGYGVSGYGGYGRPTGHGGPTGISGTLADGDEFGPSDSAYPDASVPHGNIHAQKAIALKALAGVALIGAAAALASHPVLLPIGIVTGRRKRSETFSAEEEEEEEEEGEGEGEDRTDFQMDYILYRLRENLAKIRRDGDRLIVSPRCVARLTCEIQKDYLSNFGKDVEILRTNRKYHLTNLIRNNVLNANTASANVKDLIKRAVRVASSENESCDVFPCNYVRKG